MQRGVAALEARVKAATQRADDADRTLRMERDAYGQQIEDLHTQLLEQR